MSSGKIGAIGENFVLCELMRLGFCVLTNPDPAQENWDIVVFDEATNVGLTLQVKAIQWPAPSSTTKSVLSGKFHVNFDFLVIVIVGYPNTETYLAYIIEKDNIIDSGSDNGGIPTRHGEKFKFTNRTIPFSTFPHHKSFFDSEFLNKWDLVRNLLNQRSTVMMQNQATP